MKNYLGGVWEYSNDCNFFSPVYCHYIYIMYIFPFIYLGGVREYGNIYIYIYIYFFFPPVYCHYIYKHLKSSSETEA